MRFVTIVDMSSGDSEMRGVILEAREGGIVGAVLDGEPGDRDSAKSIILRLVGQGTMGTTHRTGDHTVRRETKPGEPGYAEALVYNLKPPLGPGPTGNVIKVGAPTDMLRRVWSAVEPEAPIPALVDLSH